jgi:hypothetical protein
MASLLRHIEEVEQIAPASAALREYVIKEFAELCDAIRKMKS